MRIGDLAEATGTPVETIRYYEREGLIPAAQRSDNNYRLYSAVHAERLAFIRQCRNLDMTLDEIRSLLRLRDAPSENCGEVNALLDEHIGHVAQRIRELRTLEKDLKALRARCTSPQPDRRLRHPESTRQRADAGRRARAAPAHPRRALSLPGLARRHGLPAGASKAAAGSV